MQDEQEGTVAQETESQETEEAGTEVGEEEAQTQAEEMTTVKASELKLLVDELRQWRESAGQKEPEKEPEPEPLFTEEELEENPSLRAIQRALEPIVKENRTLKKEIAEIRSGVENQSTDRALMEFVKSHPDLQDRSKQDLYLAEVKKAMDGDDSVILDGIYAKLFGKPSKPKPKPVVTEKSTGIGATTTRSKVPSLSLDEGKERAKDAIMNMDLDAELRKRRR